MRTHQFSLLLEPPGTPSQEPKRVSYPTWNNAIAAHFFNSSRNGQPVYLQVDAETIQIIGQQLGLSPNDAEPSFLQAIRRYLFEPDPPARNINLDAKFMPRDGQAPGFIGVLALCVLAASRMERDNDLGVSAANYYGRLNKLLRLEREGRPPWFDDTVNAWQKLEEWLHVIYQGRYGIATARPLNQTHPYVGYPQSQCLLRAADRQQLPTFFRWARLEPGDMPSREWLTSMVRDWANQSRCSLSVPTKRCLLEGSDVVIDAILSIIALELQTWDGTDSGSQTGEQRQARPLLHMTIHNQQISWYRYQDETWTGLSDVLDRFTRKNHDPDDAVVVFGDHPDIGQWTSVPRISLGAMHTLLVYESEVLRVRAFLERTAKPTWQEQQLHGIPPGWHCFRGIELVRADSTAPWNGLRLQDNITVRLNGGLVLERDVYMAGFEPTLTIDGPDPVAPILLDQLALPDHAGGQTVIPLASHCSQPGYHLITVGSRTRSFITRTPHHPMLPIHALPQIAYPLRRVEDQYVPSANGTTIVTIPPMMSGIVYLSGALIYGNPEDLPGALPHTVIVQDGFRGYIVIGRQPGEIVDRRTSLGKWMAIQTTRQQTISFDVPFEPQWLIKIGQHKRYLYPLQPNVQPPTTTPIGNRCEVDAWIRAVGRKSYEKRFGQEQNVLWQAYAAVGTKLKVTH